MTGDRSRLRAVKSLEGDSARVPSWNLYILSSFLGDPRVNSELMGTLWLPKALVYS